MKNHNGMRPQDVVILLKIAAKKDQPWMMKDLSFELGISASEVSESLTRSSYAGLIAGDKKKIAKMAFLEFLEFGLKYVYPQHTGALVRGIPTAHSAAPLSNHIISEENVVWPYTEGNMRGQGIEPLHHNVPKACLKDKCLYELLALTDSLRIGRAREKKIAMELLKERIK